VPLAGPAKITEAGLGTVNFRDICPGPPKADRFVAGWMASSASSKDPSHCVQGSFARLAIPLPPLAEQVRIATEVERRLSVIDKCETVFTAI